MGKVADSIADDPLMTEADVAKETGLSKGAVRLSIYNGDLRSIEVGKMAMTRESWVMDWLSGTSEDGD
jgi:hypothetical protein